MIRTGVLNPYLLSLVARVRHTNLLVIADRGFPYWPALETVDISLVDDVPTVVQVLEALRPNLSIAQVFMAREFVEQNPPQMRERLSQALEGLAVTYEPHVEFKKRVPSAIGLIRTGDTIQYANVILVSG